MHRILVSACLLGQAVRYNATDKRCDDRVLRRWLAEGRVVAVCPEVAGGLSVPQPPAEIADEHGIRLAVLKEGSPSCGSGYSYDGTFSGTRVAVPGVTAARLQQAGLRVFSELQLAEADAYLCALDAAATD